MAVLLKHGASDISISADERVPMIYHRTVVETLHIAQVDWIRHVQVENRALLD